LTDPAARPARTLPFLLCVGWGLGTLGIAIMFNSTNILVLRFMTDQLGIAAAVGGLLVGLSKVYDACMDPVIGGISDRTRTRWGRRRPFLLAGSVLCGAVMIVLFDVPALSPDVATVYMGVALILFATAYASFNVPYLAMPAEMTDDYHERSYLMSFRVFGVSIGQALGGFLGPALIASQTDKRAGYGIMGWTLGALTLAACLACFFLTRRARFAERHEGIHMPVWRQFKLAWGNRPFMMLMGAKLCQLMSLAIVQATLAFFTVRVLHVSDVVLGVLTLLNTGGIIVTIPFWVWFSRRYGKRAAFMTSVLSYGAIMATWVFSGPDEPSALVYLRNFASGFGASGMLLMGASMLPDTMEYDFRRTGLRREGIFSGIYTTIEKIAFALGVSVLGVFLGAMGYVQSTGRDVAQPPSAITALYICIGVAPLAGAVMSCLFLWNYDLSESRLKSQQAVVS
jgi:GPH family glycoside/pentoside/hexuronide:cation symporter